MPLFLFGATREPANISSQFRRSTDRTKGRNAPFLFARISSAPAVFHWGSRAPVFSKTSATKERYQCGFRTEQWRCVLCALRTKPKVELEGVGDAGRSAAS